MMDTVQMIYQDKPQNKLKIITKKTEDINYEKDIIFDYTMQLSLCNNSSKCSLHSTNDRFIGVN